MTITKKAQVWVVEQNGFVVCGVGMGLTRFQAENKVRNERGHGTGVWYARQATAEELHPRPWSEPICED